MRALPANDGLVYMLQGNWHSANLAVSVRSALQHWKGEMCLIAGDDAGHEACQLIATESDRIRVKRWEAPTGKRGTKYLSKCAMQRLSPFDRSVFLDCDTLMMQPGLEELLPTQRFSTTFVEWSDWTTHGKKMRKRCEIFRDVWPRHVARQVGGQNSYPALNTGVLAFTKNSTFMKEWWAIGEQKVRFIIDELAAQLHYTDYPHTIKHHRFNCSPIISGDTEDVVVYHGHGSKFKKRAAGRAIWLPHFEAAYAENFGGIRELAKHDGKLYNAEAGRPCTDAELAERFDK